jgi:hypothetical protein
LQALPTVTISAIELILLRRDLRPSFATIDESRNGAASFESLRCVLNADQIKKSYIR